MRTIPPKPNIFNDRRQQAALMQPVKDVRTAGGKLLATGRGLMIAGKAGGGDMVIPSETSNEPVTKEKPLQHRPCVIEKKVHGKILKTYGTLLDPRTNPRHMQKYGYTDIEE
jgi:hypothetical protein